MHSSAEAVERHSHLTASIAKSSEILSSNDLKGRLVPYESPMLAPEFFFESLSSSWKSRIITIRDGEKLLGIVYLKERMVLGFATGVLYADGSLGTMIVEDSALQGQALYCALEVFLKRWRMRGIRLVIPPAGREAQTIREIANERRLEMNHWSLQDHACLALPSDYESFLQTLRSTTRQNFRHYRKRFEAEGCSFVNRLSPEEIRTAARQLRTKGRRPTTQSALNRALNMALVTENHWASGLKDQNGNWLSVAAGCYKDFQSVMVLLQLNNDKEHPQMSLAVVLRGYLIERFIREGRRELIFWAGAGQTLGRYCSYAPAMVVCLDKPGYGWRIVRRIAAHLARLVPSRLARDLRVLAASQ